MDSMEAFCKEKVCWEGSDASEVMSSVPNALAKSDACINTCCAAAPEDACFRTIRKDIDV